MIKRTFRVSGSHVIPQLTSSKVNTKLKEGPNPQKELLTSEKEGPTPEKKEGPNPETEGPTSPTFSDVKKYRILKLS